MTFTRVSSAGARELEPSTNFAIPKSRSLTWSAWSGSAWRNTLVGFRIAVDDSLDVREGEHAQRLAGDLQRSPER